jgi:hypothetical protein
MDMLTEIKKKIRLRLYEFSKHALDQTIVRSILVSELEDAMLNRSELIEDYPDDKYGSSCLILGFTEAKRPLHVICSYPARDLVKIITVYEPDGKLWRDYKERR